MGISQFLYRTLFRVTAISSVLLATATTLQAQTLNLSSNQFTVSVPSTTFSSTTTIANTGVVSGVTGVPTSGTLTTPTFSFTLEGTAINSTSGTYTVGIILDEQGSNRRLEVYIPGVSLSFDGSGNLTGSLTTPSVKIYGRDSSGSLTAEITAASAGSVSFNGNSISFSAADQITFIQTQGGILADITTSIDNTGLTYDYTVILAQSGGATNYAFEHSDGTDFPATGATELTLVPASNAAENTVLATNGQKLTGTVKFAAPGGGGGGGGGGSTPASEAAAVETATTDLQNALSGGGAITPAVLTQVSSLVTSTTAAAASVGSGIANGSVTVATGVDLLASLSTQISSLATGKSTAQASGDAAAAAALDSAARSTVASLKTLTAGLKNKTVTPTQIVQLKTLADSATANVRSYLQSLLASITPVSAITVSEVIAQVTPVIADLSASVNNLLTVPDFTMDNTLFTNLQDASQTAAQSVLAPLGTTLGLTVSYTDDTAAKALLGGNVTLLGRLLDITAIDIGGAAAVNDTTTQAALTAVGLNAVNAANLTTNLSTFVNPDVFSANAGAGQTTLTTTLTSALAATALTVDANTGVINYTKGSDTFARLVKSVAPAPTLLPDGQYVLADGSTLIIVNELAITMVTAADEVVEFAEAIQLAGTGGFTTAIAANGQVGLNETSSGAVFSSLFSSAALTSGTAVSNTAFEAPTGDPAASTYRFVVTFKDGTRQEILPAISDTAFFTSVQNAGFTILVDRVTGGINIAGFSFRPDYFLTPLSTDDALYLTSNADTSGVAYRAVDANGDGTTDYQVLTANGVQTVYGLP